MRSRAVGQRGLRAGTARPVGGTRAPFAALPRPIARCGLLRTPVGVPNLVCDHGSVTRRTPRSPSGALPDRRPEGICGTTPQGRAPRARLSVAAPARLRDRRPRRDRRRDRPRRQRPSAALRHHGDAAAAHRRGAGRDRPGAGLVEPVTAEPRVADVADLVKSVRLAEQQAQERARDQPGRRARPAATAASPRPASAPSSRTCAPRRSSLGCRFGEPTMFGVAGRAGTSDHPSGRAVDFMVDRRHRRRARRVRAEEPRGAGRSPT